MFRFRESILCVSLEPQVSDILNPLLLVDFELIQVPLKGERKIRDCQRELRNDETLFSQESTNGKQEMYKKHTEI
jgi:hypothetical protein